MSIAINGMEMPINCSRCPCSDDKTRFCRAANKYIPMLGKPEFCPLVTIERKTGEWIPREDEDGEHYGDKCSECGEWYVMPYGKTNFCPNCGAYMRGDEK